MIITTIRCDRCGVRILEGQPFHTIQWREITQGVKRVNNGDFLVADLCEDCYKTAIEADFAQYSRNDELHVRSVGSKEEKK